MNYVSGRTPSGGMNYVLGAVRRSHPDKLAAAKPAHAHALIRAMSVAALPASVDLDKFTPRSSDGQRADQGDTGSCTWGSSTMAFATACAAQGKPLPFVPSQKAGYGVTRAVERATATPTGDLPPLTDSGAELADVMAVYAHEGARPMICEKTPDGRFYDVWAENVNDEPSISDLEVSDGTKLEGPHLFDLSAPDISDQFAAALAAGITIEMAFDCDTVFQMLKPGQVAPPPNENDPTAGGHAVFLSGYRTLTTGERVFKLTNSWGPWCDDGRCEVSIAWIRKAWEAWAIIVKGS